MANQVPSLQNQLGAWVVNNLEEFDLEDAQTRAVTDQAVKCVWNHLKSTGSLPLQSLMDEIESEKEDGMERFCELAGTFSLDPISVDAAPYERALEDEALTIFWESKFSSHVKIENHPDAIKQWLADPLNKDSCDSLVTFSLRDVNLRTLFPQVSRFSRIHKVELYKTLLVTIPECLKQLPLLTELDMVFNRLKNIPSSIGDFTQLKGLYLRENQIETVPDELGNLTQLKSLSFQGNSLTAVPRCVKKLQLLEYLNLENNKIAGLGCLEGLTLLQTLNLAINRIQEFSSELETLTRLSVLDLSENLITVIPPSFGRITSLKMLNLGGNRIRSLPESLQNLSRLEWFVLFSGVVTIQNPILLLSPFNDVNFWRKNWIAVQKKFQEHPSQSLLARFCQKLLFADEVDQKAFFSLKEEDKLLICEMHESHNQKLFEDLFFFITAVRQAVYRKFNQLTYSEQQAVKRQLPNVDFLVDVLALIDAMDAVKSSGQNL